MKTKIFSLIATLLISANAFATGTEGGGGGKGIICPKGDGTNGVYLADTFDFVRNGGLKDIRLGDPSQMVAAIAEIIEKSHPQKLYDHPLKAGQKISLAWLFEFTGKSLHWQFQDRLKDFPDDNIDPRSLPAGCRKVQLAVQDIKNGIVNYDMGTVDKLGWVDRGLLEVHEIFVALRNQPGKDTTPIRAHVERVAKVLNNPKFELSDLILKAIAPHRRTNKTEVEWANEYYESQNCYDKYEILSKRYEKPADEKEAALCQKAARLRNIHRWMKWPKLVEFPKRLVCKTTYKSDSRLGHSDPKKFWLTRTRGSGAPDQGTWHDEKNVYAITTQDRTGAYSSNVKIDARDQQEDETKAFGSTNIEMEFASSVFSVLRIDNYNARTQTFSGSIQFGGKWLGAQNFTRGTSYGIQCDGGSVKFESEKFEKVKSNE